MQQLRVLVLLIHSPFAATHDRNIVDSPATFTANLEAGTF
jgi:hypothetical protein